MELLENIQSELNAPGLVDRTICNLVVSQALNEVGRTGWLTAGNATRRTFWGSIISAKYTFKPEIREDLLIKFTEATICVLEEYVLRGNPRMG